MIDERLLRDLEMIKKQEGIEADLSQGSGKVVLLLNAPRVSFWLCDGTILDPRLQYECKGWGISAVLDGFLLRRTAPYVYCVAGLRRSLPELLDALTVQYDEGVLRGRPKLHWKLEERLRVMAKLLNIPDDPNY